MEPREVAFAVSGEAADASTTRLYTPTAIVYFLHFASYSRLEQEASFRPLSESGDEDADDAFWLK